MDRISQLLYSLDATTRTLLLFGLIVLSAIILARFTRWVIHKSFIINQDHTPSEITRLTFLKNATSLIIWLIAIGGMIYTVPKLRALAVTLFAGAGIFLAILGFAAQQAFSNIIGGIFIVIFKPFRVGDFIKVGTLDYGWVEDITLRHTTIRSFQNRRIIIPNATISTDNIVNDTIGDPKVCRWVELDISYDSDIDKAMEIMCEEAMKHPLSIDNRTDEEKEDGVPIVITRVIELGEFFVKVRAFTWAENTPDAVTMHQELNKIIKQRFDKEDIEIPFPYRTIVYKNDILRNPND